MLSSEFETKLVQKRCYFVFPSLFVPSANRDAEYLTPDDMLKIMDNNMSDISKCVRKRAEQSGSFSYYIKNTLSTQYWKVVCPISTGASFNFLAGTMSAVRQLIDTIKVRNGLF